MENMMESAVKELGAITEELKNIKNLEEKLIANEKQIGEIVTKAERTIESYENIADKINKTCETIGKYYERINELSATIDGQLSETKKLQERMMMDKLDILLSKAELLSNSSLSSRASAISSDKADDAPKTQKKTKKNDVPDEVKTEQKEA